MKYIKKNSEPADFIQWKQRANDDWQPTWDNFQKPEKPIVHQALLIEQGHICCYCGQRITHKNSHIEHFQPQTSYPELKLDYQNFLASCPGYPEEDELKNNQSKPLHKSCGQFKGGWYDPDLTVSPLQPDCASYFRYTGIGEIIASNDNAKSKAANATIVHLNLNYKKLQASRRSAIDGVLEGIELLTSDELQTLIDGYDRLDESGQYVKFHTTVIYILQQFLS
jgi:uncharacterized protein (TIGR02646 family)